MATTMAELAAGSDLGGDPVSSGGASSSSSAPPSAGSSILSDKVMRALEVRTDTPAMKAALDALSNLPPDGPSAGSGADDAHASAKHGGSGGGAIDARSVRVAIERDALRQALLFETELRNLVGVVSDLRLSVSAVADIAGRACGSLDTNVVRRPNVGGLRGSVNPPVGDVAATESKDDGGPDADVDPASDAAGSSALLSPGNGAGLSSSSAAEEERDLASQLYDAFLDRDEASRRHEAVKAFLDKFDLSNDDAYLLDHYAFDEFDPKRRAEIAAVAAAQQQGHPAAAAYQRQETPSMDDGMAFLDALERVRRIRVALVKTFGNDAILGGAGSGALLPSSPSSAAASKSALASSTSSASNRLGATSAIRMMEGLAARQERGYERLYHFLQSFLGLNSGASVAHIPTSSAALAHRHQNQQQAAAAAAAMAFYDEDEMDESLSHPLVRRSIYVLRRAPHYRSHALELIASSRRAEVTRRFLLALTSGRDGLAPIEMKSHDPVNYVGDMLAFVFRSCSVEADLAYGLLSYRDGKNLDEDEAEEETKEVGDGCAPDSDEEEQEEESDDPLDRPMSATDILGHAVGGASRPLKSRISQVVASLARRPDGDVDGGGGGGIGADGSVVGVGEGGGTSAMSLDAAGGPAGADVDEEATAARSRVVSLYSICGLLLFYHSALEKAVRKLEARSERQQHGQKRLDDLASPSSGGTPSAAAKNPLVEAVVECLGEAAASYGASLRVYGALLEQYAGHLSPGETEATLAKDVIVKVSEARVASPGFATDVPFLSGPAGEAASKSLSLAFLCDATIEAALPYCRTLDDAVTLKGGITVAHKSGLDPECASRWDGVITEREKSMVEDLVKAETDKVLDLCGLGPLRTALDRMNGVYVEGMTMASHPGLSQVDVEMAMKEFYSSLFSPPLPSYEGIKDPAMRKYSRSKTAENVANVYRVLYEAITSDKGGYDDLAFLGHDPNQVKTLLSL